MGQSPHFLRVLLIIFILLNISLCSLFAQNEYRQNRFEPVFIPEDFIPDAAQQQAVWQKTPVLLIDHQFKPNDQIKTEVTTEVRVLYSRNFLYVGFKAFDPNPKEIRANITERDQMSKDDQVGLMIDPYNSNQFAYQLVSNPRGVQGDAIQTEGNTNEEFDLIWESFAEINSSGYSVVMKIPMKSLQFPEKEIQNWSINFVRIYPRNHDYQFSWAPIRLENSCILCQNGLMVGMKELKSSNPVDIIPYAMSFQNSSLKDSDDPSAGLKHKPIHGRMGGTLIYAPSTTSSLDVTLNPDFSQIESDATEISVNNTFAISYPEKRPFFLANENLFQSGSDLYRSRMINQPWVAAKYTQIGNRYSLALLSAYDRDAAFIVPGLLQSSTVLTHSDSYNNVLRAKYQFGEQSHIGTLLTGRNVEDAYNYVGGLDWNFYLGNYFYFSGNLAYTVTQEMNDTTVFNNQRMFGNSRFDAAFNGEKYSGTGVNVSLNRSVKYYSFGMSYQALESTFQAQNGFITGVDKKTINFSGQANYYSDKSWFSGGSLSTFTMFRYDYSNLFLERFMMTTWSNRFAGQTSISFTFFPYNDEIFRGERFERIYRYSANLYSRPIDAVSFSIRIETGKSIFRTSSPELGTGNTLFLQTTLYPTSRLELDFQYRHSSLQSLDGKRKFYDGSISRIYGRFSFTDRFFFRLISQYDSFNKEIQFYPLVFYVVNPFTKIYLGMTDYLQHSDQFATPLERGYYQTNRQFFFKMQYLFQK